MLRILLLILILFAGSPSSEATESPPAVSYRERADSMTRHIQARHWDAEARTYFDRAPRPRRGLPYSTMWGLGIQFQALAGGARFDERPHARWLAEQFDGMEQYYNREERLYSAYVGGDHDLFYDDNHWMILAYIEAHERTGDPRYLPRARGNCWRRVGAVWTTRWAAGRIGTWIA